MSHWQAMGEVAAGGGLAARAAQRRAQLLAVGFSLLGSDGVRGTTVREVCRRAQLNPRYFYESFPDLDSLLVAVFDGVVSETIGLALAAVALAPDDQAAKTRAAVETGIRHLTEDPRRIRILFAESLANAALRRRRILTIDTAAGVMIAQAAAFHVISADEPLLRSTGHFLAGGLSQLLLAWADGTLGLSVEELIDDASALIAGTGAAARAAASGRAGAAPAGA
jgi:AcrR family transcriptional regulator